MGDNQIKDWRARCENIRRWQGHSHGDPLTCDEAITLLDEVERLRTERDALRAEVEKLRNHPQAPERCPSCGWTNGWLMNYGEPGKPRWLCHGCAARAIAELERMRPVFEAAKTWAKFGRDDSDDEHELLQTIIAAITKEPP